MNTPDTSPDAVSALVARLTNYLNPARALRNTQEAAATLEALLVRVTLDQKAISDLDEVIRGWRKQVDTLKAERDDLRARLEAMTACYEQEVRKVQLDLQPQLAAAQARVARLRECWQRIRPSFKGFVDEVSEMDGRLRCYREELPRLQKELWDMDHALAQSQEVKP